MSLKPVETIARDGRRRSHGPYSLGQAFGTDAEPLPIDWAAIHAEQDAKAEQRRIVETAEVALAFRAAAAEDGAPASEPLAGRSVHRLFLPTLTAPAGGSASILP